MNTSLLSMTVDAGSYPEKGLSDVLEKCLYETGLAKATVLALQRSDAHPVYTIVTHAATRAENRPLCSLDGLHGEWFSVRSADAGVLTLTADELQVLDSRLRAFFNGPVWCVPIPGKRFIPLCRDSSTTVPGTAAVMLLGPVGEDGKQLPERERSHLLSATSLVAGDCLHEMEAREALEICARVMSAFPTLGSDATAYDLGRAVLEAMQEAVPFEAGVLYLRDLDPGFDRYLIFACAIGESRQVLLKSYWSQVEKGTTWRVMEDKRPAAGTVADLSRVQAKRTNTRAFETALPPEDVHRAWAVVPFTYGNEPVAVAHLEGVNRVQGLSRSQLQVLTIMAPLLGSAIYKWRIHARSDRRVLPDANLVSELHAVLPPPELLRNSHPGPARQFEQIVGHAFRRCLNAEDVTTRTRAEIRVATGRDQKLDCVIAMPGSRTVVIEITMEEDAKHSAGLDKLRQLSDYLDYVRDAVGILVVGGEWTEVRCGPHERKTIWVMDRPRLERFCSLSAASRTRLLLKWANEATPRIDMCDCQL